MSNELVYLVQNAQRESRVRAYIQTQKHPETELAVYDQIMIDDYDKVKKELSKLKVKNVLFEGISHHSALGLEDILKLNARVEPGAIIRKGAFIEENAVILMGAVINTGAHIGSRTMIDMNAVVGSGALIGKRCHIGAGAVIAGMMEPVSHHPVTIEDDVLIGANAVILEGVKIGHHSIIGAGAVVTKDVEPYSVMAGVPARKIKDQYHQYLIEDALRND